MGDTGKPETALEDQIFHLNRNFYSELLLKWKKRVPKVHQNMSIKSHLNGMTASFFLIHSFLSVLVSLKKVEAEH